jgi:hypothetical protein
MIKPKLIISFILTLIISTFSGIGVAQYYPVYEKRTSYVNEKYGYELLGYEKKASRFWVVIPPQYTEKQKMLNNIILDIYYNFQQRFSLDKNAWAVTFFSNKKEAGYKTFKTEAYLGEYSSCFYPDPHYRNKVFIYPTIAKKMKWYYGPSVFSCK